MSSETSSAERAASLSAKKGWASPVAPRQARISGMPSPGFTPTSPSVSPTHSTLMMGRHKETPLVVREEPTTLQTDSDEKMEFKHKRTKSAGNAGQIKKETLTQSLGEPEKDNDKDLLRNSNKHHLPKFLTNGGIDLPFHQKSKSPRKDVSPSARELSPTRRVHLSVDTRQNSTSPDVSPRTQGRQSAQLLPTKKKAETTDENHHSPSISPERPRQASFDSNQSLRLTVKDQSPHSGESQPKLEKRNSAGNLTAITPKRTMVPPPVRSTDSDQKKIKSPRGDLVSSQREGELSQKKISTSSTPTLLPSASSPTSTTPSSPSPSPSPSHPPLPSHPSDPSILRQNVIDEIITTERDYVNDLTYLIENYLTPLKYSNIAQPEHVMAIFSNAELILGVNKELLQNLERGTSSLGEAFLTVSPYFKMYSTYCNNRTICLQTVASVKQANKTFAEFIERVQADRGKFFDDYLIKPVQRICKYPLLFREMLRYTDPSSPEYEKLQKVLTALNSVVDHVNESKRRQENMARAYEISTKIDLSGVNLLSASRSYLRETPIQYRSPDDRVHDLQLILFTDLIILAKLKKEKIQTRCAVEFRMGVEFRDLPDFADPVLHNLVELVETKELSKIKYKFAFPTPEEKKEWLEIVGPLLQKSTHHP